MLPGYITLFGMLVFLFDTKRVDILSVIIKILSFIFYYDEVPGYPSHSISDLSRPRRKISQSVYCTVCSNMDKLIIIVTFPTLGQLFIFKRK